MEPTEPEKNTGQEEELNIKDLANQGDGQSGLEEINLEDFGMSNNKEGAEDMSEGEDDGDYAEDEEGMEEQNLED